VQKQELDLRLEGCMRMKAQVWKDTQEVTYILPHTSGQHIVLYVHSAQFQRNRKERMNTTCWADVLVSFTQIKYKMSGRQIKDKRVAV